MPLTSTVHDEHHIHPMRVVVLAYGVLVSYGYSTVSECLTYGVKVLYCTCMCVSYVLCKKCVCVCLILIVQVQCTRVQ